MGFYGNATLDGKTILQFDKIYPNRTELENACLTDGIALGRYVLVDYSYRGNDNYETDYNKYGKSYDSTVWVKYLDDNKQFKYLIIAKLSAEIPEINLKISPPSIDPIKPEYSKISDNEYTLKMGSLWGVDTAVNLSTDSSNENDTATWDISKSGKTYDLPSGEAGTADDKCKLSIKLPSIGKAIQQVNNAVNNINTIQTNVNTLAGKSNLINISDSDLINNTNNQSSPKEKIYKNGNKYYYWGRAEIFTPAAASSFTVGERYYTKTSDGKYQLYTGTTFTSGIGTLTYSNSYSYHLIDDYNAINNVNSCLAAVGSLLGDDNTRNSSTLKGCVNVINDWMSLPDLLDLEL